MTLYELDATCQTSQNTVDKTPTLKNMKD